MENTLTEIKIEPDDLGRRLYQYRLKAFRTGHIIASAEENPQSYIHLYRINYILKGTARLILNNQSYPVEEGHAVLVPPGGLVTQYDEQEPVEVYFINFEIGSLTQRNEFYQRMLGWFPQYQIKDHNAHLRKLFELIFQEAESHQPGGCLIVQNQFCSLLIRMIRLAQNGHAPQSLESCPVRSSHYLISRAVSYIYQNIGGRLIVGDIAEALGISEIYLYKLFKEHTGQSVQRFILNYRLQMAREYLTNPDYTVKMIADQLGFSTPYHFSAMFKKYVGVSPSEYRSSGAKTHDYFLNQE